MQTDVGKIIQDFFSRHKLFRYKKKEVILRFNDTPSGVYFLRKGFARLYGLSPEGQELTLIIFSPGDIFPLTWAINGTENKYWLETMTTSDLWRCTKEEFIAFIKQNPDVFFMFTKRMSARFDALLERMEQLVFGNAYQKIASILCLCCERFGILEKGITVIPIALTHKDIATLVGITRETVSVEMKKLEDNNIIEHRGHFVGVRDIKKLKKESLLYNE